MRDCCAIEGGLSRFFSLLEEDTNNVVALGTPLARNADNFGRIAEAKHMCIIIVMGTDSMKLLCQLSVGRVSIISWEDYGRATETIIYLLSIEVWKKTHLYLDRAGLIAY